MKQPVPAFLVLACAISWSLFALAKWGLGVQSPVGWTVVSALFMFGPALAALALRKRLGFSWQGLGLGWRQVRWKWMGLALALGLAVPLAVLCMDGLAGNVLHLAGFGRTEVSKAMLLRVAGARLETAGVPADAVAARMAGLEALPLNGAGLLAIMLVAGALAGGTINLVFALGEELGWRGLLFGLTRNRGLWKQVALTGPAWGLWHAPLILHGLNYPEHPRGGVLFMCLFTTALALPMAWVRQRSRSVLAPALLHGTINGTAGIIALFAAGTTDLFGGPAGLAGTAGVLLVGAGLLLFDPALPRTFRQA